MQFKRIAAVAAAAVVGPTVLMTTPAMAADQDQPAVSVPDSAPKDEAAAADAGAGAAAAAGAGAKQSEPSGQSDQSAKKGPDEGSDDAPSDPGYLAGPGIKVQGVPKDGFKADGSWTHLTLTVDNAGHIPVSQHSVSLGAMQWDAKFKPSQIKVERQVTDQGGNKTWRPAVLLPDDSLNRMPEFDLGSPRDLATDESYTIDVRISFASDTPAVAFELGVSGSSKVGDRVLGTPGSWVKTKIAGAVGAPEDPEAVAGPKLTLNGVPKSGFAAGGNWQEFSIHVDNAGKPDLEHLLVWFSMSRPDWVPMKNGQIQAEVYGPDEHGKVGWHEAKGWYSDGYFYSFMLADGPVRAGQNFDVKVRVRLSADAPTGFVTVQARGDGPGDEHSFVESWSVPVLSKIVPNTGNQPEPDGGAVPIVDNGPAPQTGGQVPTGQTQTAGELAATGADPATTWALGGAGVALAMGAALVAGTGRHRRRTTA
ncbi:hypothetical protein ACWGDE_28940 [Streptomyces sp. NPDC054956]